MEAESLGLKVLNAVNGQIEVSKRVLTSIKKHLVSLTA